MSELGDLTDFLKEGSAVSNLDWLNVDEQAYRDLEPVPRQNLDTVPDLEAMWRHRDEPASMFVPNTGAPRTMGDLSEAHGRLRSASEEIIRAARLAIIQTTDPQKIRSLLASRYDMTALTNAKTALATVFAERGLLGRLYVAAEDFPDCNRGSKSASEFVRRFASDAQFVVMKQACGDCSHHHQTGNGVSHCGVFHKQLLTDIPYSDGLAAEVEKAQQAKGKALQASTGHPRDRIQRAFLAADAPISTGFSGHQQIAPALAKVDAHEVLIAASNLTKKRDEANRQKMASIKARPIIAMLQKEMLKGRTEAELVHALRLSFDLRDLQETKAEWAPLFKQAGLYGAVYMTQASFDDCREGADFIHKHASKVRAVVAGEKCGSCIFNQASRCMMYGRKLVASADEVITTATVQEVLDEHRIAGKLPHDALKRHWGGTPAEALRAIHASASLAVGSAGPGTLRSSIVTAFHGTTHQAKVSDLTKRDIVKVASQYMNEGLYGEDLLQVLRSRFDPRALIATAPELRQVLAEQGLQGLKYIDPTVYDDYGNGCREASRLHRSRSAVKYAKMGSKCASCVHHTQPGQCSVLSKQLVIEPPYMDKLAEQQAVLNSGRASEVTYASLMNNGLSMMQEYQLQHQEPVLELNSQPEKREATIQFGSQEVKL